MKIPFRFFWSWTILAGSIFCRPLESAEKDKFGAEDAAQSDQFGITVSIQGSTAVVGSWHDDNVNVGSGSSYIFVQASNGVWTQLKKLIASDAGPGDTFGAAVSLSGNTLAIGAPGEDSAGTDAGAAYIFGRDEGGINQWGETLKLLPETAASRFGSSIALSGDTLVVGAPGDRSGGIDTGAAYIFERNSGGANTWGLSKRLTASDSAAGAEFGYAVAIEASTVVVGVRRSSSSAPWAGAAYVFKRDQGGTTNWGQVARLLAADASSSNNFGTAVAIAGDRVIVGAPGEDHAALAGAAYIFSRNSGGSNVWGQVEKLQSTSSSAGAHFGRSVAINGEVAVIGSPAESRGGDRAGVVSIFRRALGDPENWEEQETLTGTDTSALFQFGSAVALTGDTFLVGAPGDPHAGIDAGSTYSFSVTSQVPHPHLRKVSSSLALLSWDSANVILQATPALTPPVWTNVPTQSNGFLVELLGSSMFFRLCQPVAVSIEFVPIGQPSNPADTTGLGSLTHSYQIGRYEVSNNEYVQFLNAVARTNDPNTLYNPAMTSDPRGGIVRSGTVGDFSYASKPLFGNKPVNFVSFYDAVRFANWLHNGQPAGEQNASSTEDGAYTVSGITNISTRRAGAKVWVPTGDEWYKAAYFDPTKVMNGGYWRYPTRSDSAPAVALTDEFGNVTNATVNVANYQSGASWNGQVGNVATVGGYPSAAPLSPSYYGAADMGGNVAEWTESTNGSARSIRGGSWTDFESSLESSGGASQPPLNESDTVGFRVARP